MQAANLGLSSEAASMVAQRFALGLPVRALGQDNHYMRWDGFYGLVVADMNSWPDDEHAARSH